MSQTVHFPSAQPDFSQYLATVLAQLRGWSRNIGAQVEYANPGEKVRQLVSASRKK